MRDDYLQPADVAKLFGEYRELTGDAQAAASLVLAHTAIAANTREQPGTSASEYLTVKQAAREFNLSDRSLYRLTDLHRRNGKSVRIKRSDLQAYLEGQESLFD